MELYFADPAFKDPRPPLLQPRKKESFRFEDYCFQCKRKPGPWLKEGDTGVPTKKKLVFGVETCADHSQERLKTTSSSGPKPEVDIQLIPSAGMGITPKNVVSRNGGFVFNCDGWTASGAFRTGIVEAPRAAAIKRFYVPNWPVRSGCNPLLPHTELATVPPTAAKPYKIADLEYITPPETVDLNNAVDDIFSYGPGQLHLYPVKDLPK